MSDEIKIGERIKALRLKRGLSQKALGELCIPKIDASHIRKIESGKTQPTTETLGRIQHALQTSLIAEYLEDSNPLMEKAQRDSDEYISFSILRKICKKLGYECERYEYNDAPEEIADEAELLGLTDIEYVIDDEITITKEKFDTLFNRYIEHMAIDFKAYIEELSDGNY